ncbi:MarR family winged helix-turn-helix transcriptional regulator [Streptacidiphilus rugosus]|uniref:MarR family winged helix-turn-helix transcriptional regulator n=1 Tax=Streptacidiphilus rugosus TaxID=405783 RepID=UPI001E2D34A5|nr:MarR family transcriptional regulator [Streptacidiphilus rugosus]
MLLGRHTAMASLRRDQPSDRLDRSAYTLLTRLRTQGPMSIGQLAEAFGLDTSTVNRQTAALLRADLAERIPDPDGGLARKLRVTTEGLRRLEQDRDWAIEGLSRVLSDWTDPEVAELSRVLARLNTSIEATEGRPWPRGARSGR